MTGHQGCEATRLPVGGAIVAVVGQEVIVELPEDMEGDSPVGCRHVVVGLLVLISFVFIETHF